MNTQEKLKYIENYLKKHFDEWLVNDIKMIKDNNLHFTFPYILLVSAGIDFIGGLKENFRSRSPVRSQRFIEEWMGKINDLYKDERMSNIIYKSARCGSSHQAIFKKEIESSSWLYPREKHLNHIVDLGGTDRIFIHAWQFVDDFIGAQKLFREQYIKLNIDEVFDNLQEMLGEDKILGFDELIEDLKNRGLTFDAKEMIKNNPKVKSYDKKTFRIEMFDGSECAPSAPPSSETSTSTTTSHPSNSNITTLPNIE